ncbi:hypothetical protein [Maricaulis sp.]|uniref:hypothetical protein n=1 Tax=Maricaulis sp. TaxID=1486257 RepID=UPI0025C656EF|nr:hypothetical protein [Maricaulis sp.]
MSNWRDIFPSRETVARFSTFGGVAAILIAIVYALGLAVLRYGAEQLAWAGFAIVLMACLYLVWRAHSLGFSVTGAVLLVGVAMHLAFGTNFGGIFVQVIAAIYVLQAAWYARFLPQRKMRL